MAAFKRYLLSLPGLPKKLTDSKNYETSLIKSCGQFLLSRRCQGTNWGTWNPSANIREKRLTDPAILDGMTRDILRPRLPESILPVYALPPKEAPPWPYKEKGYKWIHQYWDGTLKRFDENTRLIVVEGNVGTQCEKFAAELAQRLGFYHVRQPKVEDILIDRYGIDKRDYYHLLPEKYCFFDSEMFFTAPDHPMVTVRAYLMFYLKFEAYCNALAHIFNTGQGVVMARHIYTDVAFVYAMHEKGFVNKEYASFYPRMKARSLDVDGFKFLPHLVVYLDCPPSLCIEKVKKRGIPWQIDSKVLDYDYFCAIEDEYKRFLKKAQKDSEVMIIDWKTPSDMDSIVDEIYKLDFTYDWNVSDKFYQWNYVSMDSDWNEIRYDLTYKQNYLQYFQHVFYQVPQLVIYPDEVVQLRYFAEKVLGKYAIGYNRSRGDSLWDIMFPAYNEHTTTGNWHEYIVRDHIWVFPFDTIIYFEKPFAPNIPEEEFQPKRFDPACLKHWNSAH